MKKRIIISVILFLVVIIEFFPINVFASASTVKTNIDTIEKLGGKNNNQNYQIIEMADELDDKEFEQWSDAMIGLITNVLSSGNIIENGANQSYLLGKSNQITNDEKEVYYEKAKIALSYLLLDIYELADLENYMVTEADVYFGPWNLGEIPILSDATGFGRIDVNEKEQKRVFSFRNKILSALGVEKVGDTQKYIQSAELTYKGALACTGLKYTTEGFTKKLDDRKKFTKEKIRAYYRSYGYNYTATSASAFATEKEELENEWCKTMGFNSTDELKEYAISVIRELGEKIQGATESEVNDLDDKTQNIEKTDPDKDTVYAQPKRISKEKGEFAADDVVNDADNFVNDPNSQSYVKTEELQGFSQNIYSILLGIGIVIAVIMGAIIGVKLMFAPLEERAEAKKLLIPYAVGCVLVFGAFGIWKLVITLLQGV